MANDQWEIFDGTSIHGPFSEDALVKTIEKGMPATMKARRVGEEKWLPVGAHEPFADALARAATTGAGRVQISPPVVMSQVVNVNPSGESGCTTGCVAILAAAALIFAISLIIGTCAK